MPSNVAVTRVSSAAITPAGRQHIERAQCQVAQITERRRYHIMILARRETSWPRHVQRERVPAPSGIPPATFTLAPFAWLVSPHRNPAARFVESRSCVLPSPWRSHCLRWPPHSPLRRHPPQASRRTGSRCRRRCRLRQSRGWISRWRVPLDAPAYARVAEAVRAGFVAAADGARPHHVCRDPARRGWYSRHAEVARRSGATVIVGPLVRDDLRVVAQTYLELPWMLALNQSEEAVLGPPQLFTFSPTVESDARTIARRMHDDAAHNVAVVGAETPLMKRFASAFTTEWLLSAGNPPNAFRFDPTPEALTVLKRDLGKKAPDAALLAVDGADAPLVKPFLGTVAAYASALVFDRKSVATLRDLDGLAIVEIPWLVTPGAPEFAKFARRDFGSESLERLYALGIDAFRIAQALTDGPPVQFVLEGATGRVTLAEGRQRARGRWPCTARATGAARWRALNHAAAGARRAGARSETMAAEFLVARASRS